MTVHPWKSTIYCLLLLGVFFYCQRAKAFEPNYDEAKVSQYTLPDQRINC